MPIIIILAILAICGLGFGGFELWQNMEKDDEIKNLRAENTELTKEKENIEKETSCNTDPEDLALTGIKAQMLIEQKRQELGYDTWTAGPAKVAKKGKKDGTEYYWVEYGENYTEDEGMSNVNTLFSLKDGEWQFDIPGFSAWTQEIYDEFNFVDL